MPCPSQPHGGAQCTLAYARESKEGELSSDGNAVPAGTMLYSSGMDDAYFVGFMARHATRAHTRGYIGCATARGEPRPAVALPFTLPRPTNDGPTAHGMSKSSMALDTQQRAACVVQ